MSGWNRQLISFPRDIAIIAGTEPSLLLWVKGSAVKKLCGSTNPSGNNKGNEGADSEEPTEGQICKTSLFQVWCNKKGKLIILYNDNFQHVLRISFLYHSQVTERLVQHYFTTFQNYCTFNCTVYQVILTLVGCKNTDKGQKRVLLHFKTA